MNVLLDTHILLWFQGMDKRLTENLREEIEYGDHECFVSRASLWEIAIKVSINKLKLDRDLHTTFRLVEDAGFLVLDITNQHLLEVSLLPLHHRDPFDRMLIAQAKVEGMQLLTADPHFASYEVTLLKA